ncbi:exoenzymes regulatory protein AepA precursor [Vibrio maritimus]|uniref:Exoenzymes regulatory protein AepA n=1 Tax=Vibrio maritimus TaxID=990268 RepID=A0A090S5Q3_9VIBR|nr:exoenzymes regulatory protein AepA precursor [Vibrio maritimus]
MRLSKYFVGALVFACSCSLHATEANIVMTGGKILTVDDAFSVADSIAITGGEITAIGSAKDIQEYIGDETQVIHLDGKTAIPGLIDNHFHFIRSAYNSQQEVRLDGISTRQEALQTLKDKAASATKGSWITVIGGWSPEQFSDDNTPFTLAELDSISKDNPVFLLLSYSSGLANSLAFLEVGQALNETGR